MGTEQMDACGGSRERWQEMPVPRGRHAKPWTRGQLRAEMAAFYGVARVEFRGRHARRLAVAS